mgnify:FL=1
MLQSELKTLEAQAKALKASLKDMSQAMQNEMGDFKLADYAGVKVTRFEKRGTIDYAALIEALGIEEAVLERYRKPSVKDVRVSTSKNGVINEGVVGNTIERSRAG